MSLLGCLNHQKISRNNIIRCWESRDLAFTQGLWTPWVSVLDLIKFVGVRYFYCLIEKEISSFSMEGSLNALSSHVWEFLCCCLALSFKRQQSLRQRHIKWRTGVSSNLFPVTQMKSWEQTGCWQGSAHVLEVPPSTSTHNCDLCKCHSPWMKGLCTLPRTQNTKAC